MGFAARTLLEALPGPAALVDTDGCVLAGNAGWAGAGYAPDGTTLPPEVPGCPEHAGMLTAVRELRPGAAPVELACRCDPAGPRVVHIAHLESDCGAHRRLITVAPAAVADDSDTTRAKSQFLALLGHEIRTPVTAVVGMVDLLRAMQLPQDVREVVDGVRRSAHSLQALTDDLLDLARLETGRLEVASEPVAVRALLENVAEPLQQQARQKRILLLTAVEPGFPARVLGDPDRLRQVVTGVVGNAVKFTERGEVVITAGSAGADGWVITISDTGPGLDDRDRARVFAPFVQADSSAARRHEGAGLGLALAARLVERMGGRIEVDSEQGVGSEFRIVLPLTAAPAGPAGRSAPALAGRKIGVIAPSPRSAQALSWLLTGSGATVLAGALDRVAELEPRVDTVLWCDDAHDEDAVRRADQVLDTLGTAARGLMISTTDPRSGVVRRPRMLTAPLLLARLCAALNSERTGVRGAPVTVPPLGGGRVLLAEDNDINRTVFRRMIQLLGVECDAVPDGAAAAEAVLTGRYDVVLMDVQMPGTDGLEATRIVRAAGLRTPILALTATALRGDRDRCLAAGMDGYLSKPITLPELRKALARYLESPAEEPAPTPSSLGVDLGKLHELEEQLEDRALVALTVSTYLAQLDDRRATLRDTLLRRDRGALKAIAHTLKSSSALLGADALAGVCARVEAMAMTDAADQELQDLVDDAEKAAAGVAEAMAGYLAEAGSDD
jgi:CheY-like chemotaxis protein/HPt (histidine-containing phosphotransfer) domain-containing protein